MAEKKNGTNGVAAAAGTGQPEQEDAPFLLRGRPRVRRIYDWKEWLVRWNDPDASEAELLGLLHQGFTAQGRSCITSERVCFLLEIADGWEFEGNFRRHGRYLPSGEWELGNSEETQAVLFGLARKALKMLCLNFFKNTSKPYGKPSWAELVTEEPVFQKLLWFFRPTTGRGESNFPRLSAFVKPSYEEEVLAVFLQEFCWFAISFNGYDDYSHRDEATRRMFLAARPQILEIMDTCGCIRMLLRQDAQPMDRFLRLDAASMAKLKELAMVRDRHCNGEVERYSSLEEAVLGDSAAASTLVLLRVRQKESERQLALREAKDLKRQAEKKLRELG